MFTYDGITISWLGHDSFLFEKGPLRIYIDPFKLGEGIKPGTLVLVTHDHFDHCSIEDLRKVVTEKTVLVAPMECASTLSKVEPGELILMEPGETRSVLGVVVTAVPAYNTNKFRDGKTPFHPKEDGKLGYLFHLGETTFYHAGDTDFIEEMKGLSCDVALLPVSGTYVMTAEEAAEAAKVIRPKVVIPMHYGTIVGGVADAERFRALLDGTGLRVEILEKS